MNSSSLGIGRRVECGCRCGHVGGCEHGSLGAVASGSYFSMQYQLSDNERRGVGDLRRKEMM